MIEITIQTNLNVSHFDALCRGYNCFGLSSGEGYTIAYLDDSATQVEQENIQTIFDNAGAAGIATDKIAITADGSDPATITCTLDANDTESIVYVYGSDGVLDIRQTVATVAGVCTYQFTTNLADTYTIVIYGTISHRSGIIEVVANG